MTTDEGEIRAEDHGKAASERLTLSYIRRAFGDNLNVARSAMGALAT